MNLDPERPKATPRTIRDRLIRHPLGRAEESPVRPETIRDRLILVAILVLAVSTRLTYLDFVEFKDDEARVAGIAVAFLEGRMLPLIGIPSSVGINNPPAFVYLMSIPLAFSRSPAVATGFIGLLGVLAVLLCYRFCDEFFGRRTAQVAAALFAVAPWCVVFSRKMQAQDVVPFFVLLLIGEIFRFSAGKGAHHLLGIALWLSLLIELHFGAVALIPLTLIALALNWRRLSGRWVLGVAGLTLLLWLPFLIFQLTHNLADLQALAALMHRPARVDLQGFQLVIDMVGVNAFSGLTGETFPRYAAVTPRFDLLGAIETDLFFAGVLLVLGRLVHTRGRATADWRHVLLILWLMIPPLFFVHHSEPLYPHYFLTVFPAPFIFIGLFASQVECWISQLTIGWPPDRPVKLATALVGYGVLASIVATQVYSFASVMNWVTRVTTAGSYGVPLRQREQAIERAVALAAGSSKPVYLAASGQDYPSAFEYLAHGRLHLKVFDDRHTFVSPADDGQPTIYLTSDPRQPASELLRRQFGADRVAVIPWPGQATGFDLYRLPSNLSARLLDRAHLQPINRTMENQVRLIGYTLDSSTVRAGEPLHLEVYWQVLNVPARPTNLSFFSHVVDDAGQVWAQDDELGYPEWFWEKGDLVVSWFTLPTRSSMEAGRGWIEFGIYRQQDVARQPLRSDDGSVADRLLFGPIKLRPAHPAPVPPPRHEQQALFGSEIFLEGYDLPAAASPGSTLPVILTWEDRRTPAVDYTVFVHLLDASGHLVAQSDGPPGPYPTTLWSPGEWIRSRHEIPLPAGLAPGVYTVEVGLYRLDTLARLPVGATDRLILATPVTIASRHG